MTLEWPATWAPAKFSHSRNKIGLVIGNRDVAGFAVPGEAQSTIFRALFMRLLPQEATSRREFFRAAARGGLLALVSAAAACLAARSQRLEGQRCVNRGICSSCGVFAACGLPQALSAKRAQEKG